MSERPGEGLIGVIVFAAAIFAVPAGYGWLQEHGWGDYPYAGNYEKCMLETMKGQAASMKDTAERYCKRAAKVEEFIGELKTTWHSDSTGST